MTPRDDDGLWAACEPPVVIDPHVIAELRDLDATGEALRTLVAMFVEKADRELERLTVAVTAGDAEGVRTIAHSLLGSAGAMGALQLVELLSSVEQAARRGALPSPATLDAIRSGAEAAQQALTCLADPSGR